MSDIISIESLLLLVCPFLLFLISSIVCCLPSGLFVDEIENHDGELWKEELRSTKNSHEVV